jgi:cytoskeletal protein CcmA (bactofilin family)
MSGSGSRRTEDLHTLRTRQLILQNQDGTYPERDSLLYVDSSNGSIRASSIKVAEGGTILIVENLESIGIAKFGGRVEISGDTTMSNAIISNTLSVLDHTYLQDVDISGSVYVYGNTTLSSCNITGNLQFNTLGITSYLNVDGSCNLGSLIVQGSTVLNNVTITGTSNINYNPTNLDIQGYLNVDGSCNLGSLNVQGTSVLNNVTVNGILVEYNLDVSGYLNVDGSCNIVGDTTIDGMLRVAQHSQFHNMDISGYLTVDGSCNLRSLNVVGTTVVNDLSVLGTTQLGTVYTNNVDISGYLTVDGSCTIGGSLNVAQASQLNNVVISEDLTVNGSMTVYGSVSVGGIFTVNDSRVIENIQDQFGGFTTASTITLRNEGYIYSTVSPSSINIYGSGLPIFGYLVWYVDSLLTYSYAPTYTIVSSCDTSGYYTMGLPDISGDITQDPLTLGYIVVSPRTIIVFNSPTINSIDGFTCDNAGRDSPTTFVNGNGKTITKITSWYVYRYDRYGDPLDGGAYFVSNSSSEGVIT